MYDEIYGNAKDGDKNAISIDSVMNYGIFSGDNDSLKELVFSVTYVAPVTWVAKNMNEAGKKNDKKAKVLFFRKSKAQLMDEGIKPKQKNADVCVNEGDAWIIFQDDKINEEKGVCEYSYGFAVVDPDVVEDCMMRDIIGNKIGVIAVGVDKDGNIKQIDDESSIDPDFLKYALETMLGD